MKFAPPPPPHLQVTVRRSAGTFPHQVCFHMLMGPFQRKQNRHHYTSLTSPLLHKAEVDWENGLDAARRRSVSLPVWLPAARAVSGEGTDAGSDKPVNWIWWRAEVSDAASTILHIWNLILLQIWSSYLHVPPIPYFSLCLCVLNKTSEEDSLCLQLSSFAFSAFCFVWFLLGISLNLDKVVTTQCYPKMSLLPGWRC